MPDFAIAKSGMRGFALFCVSCFNGAHGNQCIGRKNRQ